MSKFERAREVAGTIMDKTLDGITYLQYLGDQAHRYVDRQRNRVAYEISQLLAFERNTHEEGDLIDDER